MVASFADTFTSVCVLAEPAVPGDVTAAAEFFLGVCYPFLAALWARVSDFSVLCGLQFPVIFHSVETTVCWQSFHKCHSFVCFGEQLTLLRSQLLFFATSGSLLRSVLPDKLTRCSGRLSFLVFLLVDREGIVQMRGSTADTCTCNSLGGIRFYGPLVSGVCAVREVQELGFSESRLQDCFRVLFAWFDSEYMHMGQSWRLSVYFPMFFYVHVDVGS